ncbi:autotransporter assembly complex family protein, partial [Gemmatimonadota bacterium]
RADDRVFPTRGHSLSFRVRGSHDALLSDTRFLQVGAEGKLVRSLGPRVRILARGEVGALLSQEFGVLPAQFRYFAGGDRSVRGHRYQALGPLDEEGNVSGGNRILVASVESDYRFRERWGLAAFLDVGNALMGLSGALEKSAGLGVRWRSPIGPVRLDGAFVLNRSGLPFRIHLNIGPEL